MKTITIAVLAASFLVLAGCVEATDVAPSVPAMTPVGPFITTFDGSVSNAAIDACRHKLDSMTDGAVQVVGSEFSQANNAVYMVVGANRAPWRCLVSNDGSGASVEFVGREGAL